MVLVFLCMCVHVCAGAHVYVWVCAHVKARKQFSIIPQVPSTLAFGDRVSTGLKLAKQAGLSGCPAPGATCLRLSSAGITGACSVWF